MPSYKLDLRKDPDDVRDFPFLCSLNVADLKNGLQLPSVNVVDHTPLMSPVKDQGSLGSCVGFAVSAMKEWQERSEELSEIASGKKSKKASKVYDLSEAWIYWNAKKIDGYPDEEGTSIRYAMKVLNKIGVPTESAWPYSDQFKGEPSSWAKLIAKWSLVGSYYRIKSLDELLTALVKSPIVVGISCFEEIFRVDDTGVVPMPKNPQYSYGGHAICLCGFDKHKERVKFKNSWSTNWGDKGYGYLSYDYLRAYMWDAWTCIDISVTSKMLKGPTAKL
jgi:C1A family cysteine protease